MNVIEGRSAPGDLRLDADVVVVGSGAGGAVVAKVLAEAGRDVVVLEEGGYVPESKYAGQPVSETMWRMGREAFTTAAVPLGDTPVISVLAGRAVGGSSTLTGGVCFRIPDLVTSHWARDLGLASMSTEALAPMFDDVEREIGVGEVPVAMRSRATNLLVEAAKKRGIEFHPLRRNTTDCRGASNCNFGCPYHAKMSVDRNYLPKAVAKGARLHADVRVDRVTHDGARVTGVEGVVLGSRGERRGRAVVRAKTVVVAAGTLHTPGILRSTGIARRAEQGLGRHITLHPTFRAAALFDDPVDAWKGSMQSVWTDHFEDEGLTLMNAFPPVNILAGAMPGLGPEYMKRVRQMGHLATFGGIVHDEGGGRLWRIPGREPLLTYRMDPRDRERFLRGMKLIAELFFEMGAREVFLPIFGAEPLKTRDALDGVMSRPIRSRLIETVTYHPLGSARMGRDPKHAVVDEHGESHELKGLFVADGSVLPTSLGVNSQLPIMGVATKIAWGIRDRAPS